jgi:hypothetical protein
MKKIKDSKQLVFDFMKGDDIKFISKYWEILSSTDSSWLYPYNYVFNSDNS